MKNNVGIRTLLKNGLSALVISASTISSMPSRVEAKPLPEISVSSGKDVESLIIENSKYVFDPSLTIPDGASFGSSEFKNGSIGLGGVNQIMNFLFALPGKFRRPAFMADRHFGKRVPNYVELDWHKFDSTHMTIGAYEGEEQMLDDVMRSEEENFGELKERFGFSEFQKKPIMVYYRNGTEFLQDKMFWPGRGILGVTKVLGRNEMATYFNGHKEDFASTNKHEFVHWFDLQRMASLGKDTMKNMDLWMVEGLAEYYSTGWRTVHEQMMRDLWSNGVFIPIEELNRYGGFLTYTLGNFYTKFLEETFGPGTALKLRDNARLGDISEIIKATTKHDIGEVNRMAREYAHEMFKDIDGKVDERKVLSDGFLLGSDRGRFLTGDFDDGHIKLYVNKVKADGKVARGEVARDADYGSESLIGLFFGDAAGIKKDKVVFSVSDGGRDKLVMKSFLVDGDEFNFNEVAEKSFPEITEIYSPRLVDDKSVVFVGSVEGYHDIFSYDFSSDKLSRLTSSKRGIRGLDVHGDSVVFSMEEDGAVDSQGLDYNYNLHILDLKNGTTSRLTETQGDSVRPIFSPDGKYVVFQRDIDFVNNMFIHDLKTGIDVRLDIETTGAEGPQFMGVDKVLFNTRNLLEPKVRVREIGSLESLVREAIEDSTADDIGTFRIRKNELLLKDALVGEDSRMRVNGNAVKELVFHKGVFYASNDSDFYEINSSGIVRRNPIPLELRKKYFSEGISKDIDFLEHNSSIYHYSVNEDRTRAIIILNDNFLNKDAFGKLGYNIPEGSMPILVYNGTQNLFNKSKPRMFYNTVPEIQAKGTVSSTEFLADGDIILRYQNSIVSLFSNISRGADLAKLMETEGLKGAIERQVFSDDKHLMAFNIRRSRMFGNDDHFVVLYNDRDPYPWKVLLNTDDYIVGNLNFVDGNKLFFTAENEELIGFHLYDPATIDMKEKTFTRNGGGKLSDVVCAGEEMLFSMTEEGTASQLYSGSFSRDTFKQVSYGERHSKLRSIDDLLLYEESDNYGSSELKALDKDAVVIHPRKAKNARSAHVVVDENNGALYDLDLSRMSVKKLAVESLGFDVRESEVVFSKAENGLFNIFSYNTETGEQKALTKNGFNSFRPVFADGAVYYEADDHGESYIRKIKDGVDERVPLSAPVAWLEVVHSELQGRVLHKKKDDKPEDKRYPYNKEILSSGRFSQIPIYDKHGNVLLAFDGRNVMGVADFAAQNELNTNLAFVSLYHSPAFKMGSAGFVDLARDFGVEGDWVGFGRNIDMSLNFVKSRPLNAYLGADGSLGIAYQDYPKYKTGTRNNLYPVVGASVSYDDTTFDYLRGPREGTRGFLRLESGYSVTDNKMNNYDVNFDLRNYIPIAGRSGFDQRIMAGTSQGPNNHFFLLGGNMSMRGIPFDGLYAQSYAVGNLDIRFPLFEAVGAVLVGTNYLHPIFSAFDVRVGPYFDGALVGINGQEPKFVYSGGYDFNAIFFGSMILRYNKGMVGEKDWNFWLGYNP